MKQIQIKEYPKNTTSKAKSKNFHPKDLIKPVTTKKQRIIDFIKDTITKKGYCSYSQSSIAEMFNCSRDYVGDIYSLLKEDPTFKITTKPYFTCIIYFSCLISSLLSGNPALINSLKRSNSYISYNSNTKKSEYMSNEQRYASVVTNLNKLYKNEDVQPDYVDLPQKKPIIYAKPSQNSQKRESNKPDCKNIAINRAKRLFEEAQKGRRNRFYIKQNIKVVLQDFPSSIDEFEQWFYSSDGKDFKLWLGYELQDFFQAQTG